MNRTPIEALAKDVEHVRLDIHGRVLHVVLDRPEVLNALHPPAHAELNRVFDAFAADPELWIAVVRGAGERAFCAGSDLKVRAKTGVVDFPAGGFAGITHRFDLDKPVVAAVNGFALGGGLEIVLACDIVIAADHAEFGFPEPRVGLVAASGGVHRLVRQIPLKQAMDLLLTGRRISAVEALRLGRVSEVIPAEQLDEIVDRRVNEILRCAPLSVRATKQIAQRSLDHASLADALDANYPAVAAMHASRDAQEGQEAFVEKRSPEWQGR